MGVDAILDLAVRPLLIVGVPRSGTTWVQRLMLSHPATCGGQESHFFEAVSNTLRVFDRDLDSDRHKGLPAYWTREGFRDQVRLFWAATVEPLLREHPDAELLIEKTPDHVLHVSQIAELLPGARFIHVIRDSRAVAASMLAANRSDWGKWAPGDAKKAARTWHRFLSAGRRAGQKLPPERYAEVRYEDLKADTAGELARLWRFAGLSSDQERIDAAVASQDFDRQQKIGGSELPRFGEKSGGMAKKEPTGFFRRGSTDSWKTELSLVQQLTVWRYTRKLMRACGYGWAGVHPKERT